MHLWAFTLYGHLVDRNSVREELAVESHTALVLRVKAVVIQIRQVDFGGSDLFAVQAVDKLLHKGLCGAAVKGDMMDSQMKDHAAVGNRIKGRTNRNSGIQIERLGVIVDDPYNFLA